MTIITILLIILGVAMVLKLLESMGKALPYVIIYGAIYWLSFYVWNPICWIIAVLITIGFVKVEWDKHYKGVISN